MMQTDPGPCQSSFTLRVLIVDDNVDSAEALSALLESMGCTTAVAFDGAQALAAAVAFEPHLALIDLEMPNMSGCEVACHLHLNAGQVRKVRSSVRLVCLTGRGEPVDRRLCLDAGFDDFYTKPLPSESLLQLVSAAKAALC